jgi:hypothetical protein
MFECVICHSVNHASRLQCSVCGTVPACYSTTGKPSRLTDEFVNLEVVAAYGVSRASEHHAAKMFLRTVELDYYAESAE